MSADYPNVAQSEESVLLEEIDQSDPEQMDQLLSFAGYLVAKFGFSAGMDILSYYQRLNWISPQVRDDMLRHMRGADSDARVQLPNLDEALEAVAGGPFDEHLPSLQYILNMSDANPEAVTAQLRAVA